MANSQDASIGFGTETAFGTPVTSTRWLEFLSESFDLKKTIKQGQGLRVGSRVGRSGRRVVVTREGGGAVTIEAISKGMGLWLQNLIGAGTSTLVSGATYQQVFTLADVMPMFTLQRGLPRVDGTIDCDTFTGCTTKSVEFDFKNADLVQIKADIDARDLNMITAYTTPTYAAGASLFSFAGATITTGVLTPPTAIALATSPTSLAMVRGGSVKIDHKLTDNRFNAGGGGLKARQPVGLREISGKLTVEHDNTFDWPAAINAETPMNLILNWTAGVLGVGLETLQIVIPEIKLDGSMPQTNGTDLITHDVTFQGLDNLTAAQPIWVVMRTADVAL
jgi:Phage tail tube protein